MPFSEAMEPMFTTRPPAGLGHRRDERAAEEVGRDGVDGQHPLEVGGGGARAAAPRARRRRCSPAPRAPGPGRRARPRAPPPALASARSAVARNSRAACSPASRRSDAALSTVRTTAVTGQPARRKARAMALPMPRLAPVTTAPRIRSSVMVGADPSSGRVRTMTTLGILTSGGDSPGMNAALRAAAKTCAARGVRLLGVRDGYEGLLDGRSVELVPGPCALLGEGGLDMLGSQGGTVLGSARSARFREAAGRAGAAEVPEVLGRGGAGGHRRQRFADRSPRPRPGARGAG